MAGAVLASDSHNISPDVLAALNSGISALTQSIKSLTETLSSFKGGLLSGGSKGGPPNPGAGKGAGGAAKGAGGLGKAGAALGAVGAAIGAIVGFVQVMKGFTEALAPSVIMEFNRALRDLNATVGYAAVPMFQVLTDVVRQLSGIILPVMQELRPVLTNLTQSLGGLLLSSVRLLASAFSLLSPLLFFFASGLQIVTTPLTMLADVLTIVVRVLNDLVSSLFGGKLTMDEVQKSTNFFSKLIQQAGVGLVALVGTILKLVGATKSLDAILGQFKKLKAERDKPPGGLKAAATSSTVTGAAELAKSLAAAAAIASGGGSVTKTADVFYAESIEALEGIQSGQIDLVSALGKKLDDIKDAIIEQGRKAASSAVDTITPGILKTPRADSTGQKISQGLQWLGMHAPGTETAADAVGNSVNFLNRNLNPFR